MAEFRVDGQHLVLELTGREKVASLHGALRVPLSAVRSAEVVEEPLRAVRGIRAPGYAWPGRAKIGTWRRRGGRTFAVARAGRPAVRVVLDGQRYTEIIADVADPARVVAGLR